MSTKSIIDEFKAYRKDNATAIQMLIKSDVVAKQYYEGIAEATEDFTDYDAEILEATDFIEVMSRFNSKMKPFLSRSKGEPPTVGVYTVPKDAPKPKRAFNKEDRVRNLNDGKIGTIYDYDERNGTYFYRINWDNSRIAQAGVPENLLAKVEAEQPKGKYKAGDFVTWNNERVAGMVFKVKYSFEDNGRPLYSLESENGVEFGGRVPEDELIGSTKAAFERQSKPKAKPLTKPKNSKLVTAKNTAKPTKKGMKPVRKEKPKYKVGDYLSFGAGYEMKGVIVGIIESKGVNKLEIEVINGTPIQVQNSNSKLKKISESLYNSSLERYKSEAKAKAERQSKPKSKPLNKPKNSKLVTAKNTAKPSKTGMKPAAKPKAQEKEVKKGKPKAMPKVTVKPKATPKPKITAPKPEPKPQTVTHIETQEHKQVKKYLAIRKKETLQLAMTAYKSLGKDIAERRIRATSPQANVIRAIQKSYYKYLTRQTASLVLNESMLKEATDFVGSQKPSEVVELVKRFIRFTGVSPTEKQLKDYLRDAEKVLKTTKDTDPYADELHDIVKTVKAAKVGDTIIADTVGLSGLNSNTIKVRK